MCSVSGNYAIYDFVNRNGDTTVTETFINFLLNLGDLAHVSNAIHGFIEQNLVLILVAKQYVQ